MQAEMLETVPLFFSAWLVAGFLNNIAGLGAAMVAMPMVTTMLPMSLAVPSSTLIVLTLNAQLTWRYRRHIPWRDLRFLALGALLGAGLGVQALRAVPETSLKLVMGLCLMGYALYAVFGKLAKPEALRPRWGVVAGLLSTLFGGAVGFNGPPLAVFASLAPGWSKDVARGGLGACFLCTGGAILAGQLLSGLQGAQSLAYAAVAIPAVLLGGWLGIRVSSRLGERSYRTVLLALLFFAGVSILYSTIQPSLPGPS